MLNTGLSSDCWKPPTPEVIFHVFASLFEPLENTIRWSHTRVWHHLISIHLLQQSVRIWWSFPCWSRNFKLFHCSLPIAWWPKIKELLIKAHEKTYNDCREPKSVTYFPILCHTVMQPANSYPTHNSCSTISPVTFLTHLIISISCKNSKIFQV